MEIILLLFILIKMVYFIEICYTKKGDLMLNFIAQRRHDECGLACMLMILQYYDCPLNYLALRFLSPKQPSFYDMHYLFCLLGLTSSSYLVKDCALKRIDTLPVILHLRGFFACHYVVLEKIEGKKALVANPAAFGKRFMSLKKLQRVWTGYYLVVKGPKISSKKLPASLAYPWRFLASTLLLTALFFFLFCWLF